MQDDVERVARAFLVATHGSCEVTDWKERNWNPSVAGAWDAATAALAALDLPARDAANVAKGLSMAADIAQCAFDDRPRSRVGHPSQTDWDDGYRDATRAAAAAIRALIADTTT